MSGEEFHSANDDFFPIPWKADTVLQPVNACMNSNPHAAPFPSLDAILWTGM